MTLSCGIILLLDEIDLLDSQGNEIDGPTISYFFVNNHIKIVLKYYSINGNTDGLQFKFRPKLQEAKTKVEESKLLKFLQFLIDSPLFQLRIHGLYAVVTYKMQMAIDSLYPALEIGIQGGNSVTLSGGYFIEVSPVCCHFGSIAVPGTILNPFQVLCISPPVSFFGNVPVSLSIGTIFSTEVLTYTYFNETLEPFFTVEADPSNLGKS